MKKHAILISIFAVAFSFILGASFVKAETREFRVPIIERPSNIFERIASDFGLNKILNKVLASEIYREGATIGSDGDDASYAGDGMVKVNDGGGGADDGYFYLSLPTKFIPASKERLDLELEPGSCSKEIMEEKEREGQDICFKSRSSAGKTIHPWRVYKSEIVTYHTNVTPNSGDCKMNVYITEVGARCQGATFYGASDGYCTSSVTSDKPLNPPVGSSCKEGEPNCACDESGFKGKIICKIVAPTIQKNTVTAYLDESHFSDKGAGQVCGHTRVDGGDWGGKNTWTGFLSAWAKSPEFENFGLRGKDSDSGQTKTVVSGQTISICSGENVELFWDTKDVQETWISYGSVDATICSDCGDPGKSVQVPFSGSKTVKPLNNTSFSLMVKAATGDGPLYISPDPVYVSLKDCTTPVGDPEVTLKVNNDDGPISINSGESANLSWSSKNADTCSASWTEKKSSSGSETVSNITANKTFTISCWNASSPDKKASDSAVVNVKTASEGYVDLKINGGNDPVKISSGGSVDLSWESKNADKCVASGGGWTGNKDASGSEVISNITAKQTFTIKCDASGKEVSDSVNVTIDTTPVLTKGSIEVKIRLDGKEVSNTAANPVTYRLTGPQTITGNSNQSYNDVKTGTYTISRTGAGVPGEEATFNNSGYKPARVLLVKKDETTTFYLDFFTLVACNLRVEAECDGSAWSGAIPYTISGTDTNLTGTNVPKDFNGVPAIEYTLGDLVSGPGTFDTISPSNPLTCPANGQATFKMKFKNCGGGYNYRFKCNSSNSCVICNGDNIECPYSSLSSCRAVCSGGTPNCDAKAEIGCWTNSANPSDFEKCVGVADAENPSIRLTSNLAGCSNVTCKWEVPGYPSQNSCAPLSFYDEVGSHKATLTVTNSKTGSSSTEGTSIVTKNFSIKGIDGVACNFIWSPENPTLGSGLTLTDTSAVAKGESITSWKWTIGGGDPASSTEAIVSGVRFKSAGFKTITLKATTDKGHTCTLSKQVNIRKIVPQWWEVVPK